MTENAILKGVGAASGIAVGKAFFWEEPELKVEMKTIADPGREEKRFLAAVASTRRDLESLKTAAAKKLGAAEVKIFEAHLLMAEDPELVDGVLKMIREEKVNAEYGVEKVIQNYGAILENLDNDYLRERVADLKDVGRRIIRHLLGIKGHSLGEIDRECIIVADDLTPSDTAQLDQEKVLGFVTAKGGITSHTAIIARSLGIPAIVGLGNEIRKIKDGSLIIIDGDQGEIVIEPDESRIKAYEEKQGKLREYRKHLTVLKGKESVSKDGKTVLIAANIGDPSGAEKALDCGCDGIGLFRTEFLYMSKERLPSEEEQFEAYREVLAKMGEKPVIIRTLDIGGDKNLSYLPIGEEFNPALGYRAIRFCLKEKEIFKTQLRAVLRAADFCRGPGGLQVMFPMISSIQEFREARRILDETRRELNEAQVKCGKLQVGMMVEIPSAAVLSDVFAKEADFFSIGTNDLIQYTLAVDRMNDKVSDLYDQFHPAVLRLIKLTIDNAHAEGKPVGICGETAGNPDLIPLFFGMGVDELSMNPASVLPARDLIRKTEYQKAKALVEQVIRAESSVEVKEYLEAYQIESELGGKDG